MQSANSDNLTSHFLTQFFNRLNEEKLTYCVLRNYEELPERVGNDVDIWIKDEHRKKLHAIVRDLSYTLDYTLDYTPRLTLIGEGDYFLIKEINRKFNIIHLDCWTYIHWKGISFIEESIIKKKLMWHKNLFFIPAPGIRASIILLKELLQHGKVKEKYKDIIKEYSSADRDIFLKSIYKSFGGSTAYSILKMAINEEWKDLEQKANKLKLILFLRAFLHPLKQLRNWLYYLRAQFRRFFINSRGIFLVLIGPDGSGKSTTSNNLIDSEIKRLFQKKYYFHGHFPFLPELKKIVVFFRGNKNMAQPSENVGSSKPLMTLRSMIYPIYYGFNYFLGHFFIWKEKARGNLIIFDRYFYDYLIQRQYINCPRWLLNLITKVIPKPDVIVYLKNSPETIYNRKPELTIEEIERQVEVCEHIVRRFKNNVVIETTTPEEVTEKIQRVIVNKMREKQKVKK
ncbi:MAG: hypothetical protein QME48_08905 [bacterium]|nr:hypothetical protein [bacterium]